MSHHRNNNNGAKLTRRARRKFYQALGPPTFPLFMVAGGWILKTIGSHMPFIKLLRDGQTVCNLGSAGFTLDGDPRPSWVLCEPTETGPRFSVRRVAYDIERAISYLREVGYLGFEGEHRQRAYCQMLRTGIHWRAHL